MDNEQHLEKVIVEEQGLNIYDSGACNHRMP
jgi:hypothetical protein